MNLFGLAFASPLVLFGLLALPLIWWLLRLTPPKPKEEVFPPTKILAEIAKNEETPANSPWWLTLLRLLMAALVILALSEPIWNEDEKSLSGSGPLLVVMDDSWSSGPNWNERVASAQVLLDDAGEAGRPVALAFTSEGAKADLTTMRAEAVKARLAAAKPYPVPVDLTFLAEKLAAADVTFEELSWLSSGLDRDGTKQFVDALTQLKIERVVYFAPNNDGLSVLTAVSNTPEALVVKLERPTISSQQEGRATAFDLQGRSLSSAEFVFKSSEQEAEIQFPLPVELRNEIARISIDGASHAGAVQLLDERFRRRRVGLISGGNADQAQPLLSPLYYISRALNPFSEVRPARSSDITQAVPELINERISTLVLADIGTLPTATQEEVEKWVNGGGMLVRFSGPRLAGVKDDTLVPVTLRRGGRSLGGTLTWGTPQPLASFDQDSPFAGITVPKDVTVTRQVLAEPGIELAERTWASLEDGTPLVTASKRGDGWIVLFHVTADAGWSNLPLSGSFVDMLRRIVAVSNGAIAADKTRAGTASSGETTQSNSVTLPPLRMIDGFGVLSAPDVAVQPLKLTPAQSVVVSLENPPGTYGTNDAFVAVNLFKGPANLKILDPSTLPTGTVQKAYKAGTAFMLKPWLLAAALLLLALDCLAVLWMSGAIRRPAKTAAALVMLVVLFPPISQEVSAQEKTINIEDTLRTRIAYVKTGDTRLDSISRKGLIGLTQFIGSRTSLEPGEPVGIDIATDELAFYPLLYWPISTSGSVPNDKTMARVDAFMKKGGSVLFDTRDQLSGGFGSQRVSPETQRLRQILSSLDVPPLEPVPDNHVLTRAFYLLNVFPGRYLDGRLWVESSQSEEEENAERPTRVGDGVSSILITSNDLAGAWAVEANGSPSLPIVPPNPTQRVYAYRTGVNIVMYTLTGNYKSDQVHIPALLERLGQ